MKIKAVPEDFIVEEIIRAPLRKRGDFSFYRLRKKNENTIELLHRISKKLEIPFSRFSYGGRKDRHALSTQYIAIQDAHIIKDLRDKAFSLEFAGFLDRPMGPDLIASNRFQIIVRDLNPKDRSCREVEIEKIRKGGFINYFDDQRFGSFDTRGGFLGEKILKGHFNGALKIYLTRSSSEDKREDRERKDFFIDHWGQWSACQKEAKKGFEKMAFDHLEKDPKGFLFLLRAIPAEELTLFYSAYQAFLWNEVVRRWVRQHAQAPLLSHRGRTGDYLFYDAPDMDRLGTFKQLAVPLAASPMKYPDANVEKIYKDIFEENGLKPPMFNITKIRQAYYKSVNRQVIAVPEGLTFSESPDERDERMCKLCLKFSLPSGTYATMLIKRIFSPGG